MPLEIGSTLGVYEVTAAIGAGGMGEVYKARDTKLDRDVALKILPEAFVNDAERLARFQREAKVLASLNHPNIAAIHGLEESGGSPALVLEYVEGPTLQDRISQGLIPLDEALHIARQIAEALEAAHEQGIIHRDLKPANVKVKDDGTVKVLDFGLAKALEPEQTEHEAANSPTMTMTAAATKMGVIMGTAAYMAPEQAKGRQVDRRADIWAFGAVLYEMLTGTGAFQGEDISSTLAKVIEREPDWAQLPELTPPAIRTLMRRCLVKERKRRIPDIGIASIEIGDTLSGTGEAPSYRPAPVAAPQVWQRPIAIAVLVLAAVVVTAFTLRNQAPPAENPIVRVQVPIGQDATYTSFGRHSLAISPDGSQIVYTADFGLWLRPVDQLRATPIAGTGDFPGAVNPFFSPDGEWIGYQAGTQLKKILVTGGAPVTLGTVPEFTFGFSWGADDTIFFGAGPEGIWSMSAEGGVAEQVIELAPGEAAQGPRMLPGGEWVLWTLRSFGRISWDESQIVVQSLATGERQVLVDPGHDARYLPTGHLVYDLNGVLYGLPFDLDTREATGGPVPLVEGVRTSFVAGPAHYSVASNGSLVYLQGTAGDDELVELIWVDRTGQIELIGAEARAYTWVRVSPDGTRLAVSIRDANPDIWVYSLTQKTLTRLTFHEARDAFPMWTPDGSHLVFASGRDGGGLFWKAADGTGEVELLLEGSGEDLYRPYTWSADGQLIFERGSGGIGILAVDGDRSVEVVLDDGALGVSPEISPDGRWLAYSSTESGRQEVYVQPFPATEAGKWQVSAETGYTPMWGPDSRELFFVTTNDEIARATIETEPSFNIVARENLFSRAGFANINGREQDLAPDGERFVFMRRPGGSTDEIADGFVFVQNWFEELNERVPVR